MRYEYGYLGAGSAKNLAEVLRSETIPMQGHGDPNAIQDCWNSLEEELQAINERLNLANKKLTTLKNMIQDKATTYLIDEVQDLISTPDWRSD